MKMVNGYNRPQEKREIAQAIRDVITNHDWRCKVCGVNILPMELFCSNCKSTFTWLVENGDPICISTKRSP
jgi:uncharacterized OB-fold protein